MEINAIIIRPTFIRHARIILANIIMISKINDIKSIQIIKINFWSKKICKINFGLKIYLKSLI